MNILRQEVRFQARTVISWAVSLVMVLLVFMGLYPGFAREADTLKEALGLFPRALLSSIGMDVDKIFEASGFVSYIYGFVQLFLGVMGALFGFQMLGREKMARMNDFLFARPVTRTSVFLQKVLVALLSFVLIHIVLYLLFHAMASAWAIDGANLTAIDQILLGGFLLQLLLFCLAGLLAVLSRRIKNPVGAASGLGFGLFLILMTGRLMDEDKVKKLSPFGYVEPLEIAVRGLSAATILGFAALSLLLLALTGLALTRQDLEG